MGVGRFGILLIGWLTSGAALAQSGGGQSFTFLHQPPDARTAALGGVTPGLVSDNDVNRVFSNPAALASESQRHVALSYVPGYAGVKRSALAYAWQRGKATWSGGLRYVNYGDLEERDAAGTLLGTFVSRDYAVQVSRTQTLNGYTLGAAVKLVGSQVGSYGAHAVVMDLGGIFKHPTSDFSVGLLVKNAGFAFDRFTPETAVTVPFDVQLGAAIKPQFMPVRFILTAHHLHRFNIALDNPNQRGRLDANGVAVTEKITFGDKLLRHFAVGAELLPDKAFGVQVGYNHLVRREMRLASTAAGAGLSFGLRLKTKTWLLHYARSWRHAAGGESYLTLGVNLNRLTKKGVTPTPQ